MTANPSYLAAIISILLLQSFCPVWSSDSETSAAGIAAQRALALPKAMAGVMAGLAIGVPIKINKDIRSETRRLAGALRQDMGNEFGIFENVVVIGGAVPFGVLGGTILGTIRGTEHALTYGSHQPFSRESLSLKEPYQEPDKNSKSD